MIENKTPNDTNDNYVKPLWNAIVHTPKMYAVIVQPNFLHHDQHFGYFLNGNFPVKHILIPAFPCVGQVCYWLTALHCIHKNDMGF